MPRKRRTPTTEKTHPSVNPPPTDAQPTTAPTWSARRVKLSELQPWARNPRRISEAAAARMADSFATFGQVELLALGPNLEVYNGHQRLKVLSQLHGADYEVEARVCSRELTEKEREKLTIYLHRGAAGEFDLEALLADWNVAELDAWGLPDLNIPDVPEDTWQDMPEFDGAPRGYARLTVCFESEADLTKFAALIEQSVTKDTRSIWYPYQAPRDLSTEQWSAEP